MFDTEIQSAASAWNVPVSWIQAVIEVESSWNPKAYRAEPDQGDASFGLMQLLGKTAASLGYTGTAEGLYEPSTNISLGAELLSQLRAKYGDDFRRVYSAYNSGRPDLWKYSTQVAANVARALAALVRYSSETVTSSGSAMTLAILFILVWMFKKKG